MKFEELSKEHQEFLMYCLSDYIKSRIRKLTIDGVIFPSYEEYKSFFNEFDEEYHIVDSKFEGTKLPLSQRYRAGSSRG